MSSAKYRRIAVITARRGSSRLKRKALIEFNGTPLIAHTILAALDSKCFETVVTSSDDAEFLQMAADFSAIPLERNSALATASATTAPVLIDVLEHEQEMGKS